MMIKRGDIYYADLRPVVGSEPVSYTHLVDKKSPLVAEVKKWVDQEYEKGRVTAITDGELEKVIKESSKKLNVNLIP